LDTSERQANFKTRLLVPPGIAYLTLIASIRIENLTTMRIMDQVQKPTSDINYQENQIFKQGICSREKMKMLAD
jgi:hypothetical protein